MVGTFFRALGRGLQAVGRALSRRRAGGGDEVHDDSQVPPPPDRYVWDPYNSDYCEKCQAKIRGRASILVHYDGTIEGDPDDIPPLHPHCDCAMRNQRTGSFAFNAAGGP